MAEMPLGALGAALLALLSLVLSWLVTTRRVALPLGTEYGLGLVALACGAAAVGLWEGSVCTAEEKVARLALLGAGLCMLGLSATAAWRRRLRSAQPENIQPAGRAGNEGVTSP